MIPSTTFFLDIETVPSSKDIPRGDVAKLFAHKFRREIDELSKGGYPGSSNKDVLLDRMWPEKAGLFAEFGKVACIGLGFIATDKKEGSEPTLRVKSFVSKDEMSILTKAAAILEKAVVLVSHNGEEFDWPFLFRRFLINGLPIPAVLNVAGKKPWEVPHVDTMKLWSHLQYKHRCSLDLLAYCMGLPSPKQEMSGDQVAGFFYQEIKPAKDQLPFDAEEDILRQTGNYCTGDVVTLANVYCRLKGEPLPKVEYLDKIA